ncbi:B/F/G family RNA polymerase sigma-70 factor [Streptomyces triticagri]|uniref:B/F/G family RNA polymerase sigma-70 factor n=2 Tax=Streptomyces triticagri TaxID=2293568 RepID=A0A372LWQ6_9ACTN|nr:sigma-70 family RNA polymerase sigma factor [Streptomyces triticagri]RFU82725.1 B/F/G family RNA polymerase sigma-70 factor [Streptomyces triticagri]
MQTLPAGPEHEVIEQRLIRAWLPMATRLADKYRDRGEEREDLRQVAALGLCKAVQGYDPGRGAFEAYAVPTITGELRRHFRDHTWGVHVPRRVQDLRNRVRTALQLMPDGGSARQVATVAGLTEEEARQGLEALHSYRPLSLSAQPAAQPDGSGLGEYLGETDEGFDVVDDREAARPGLSRLPERERRVLYLRFFRDMTQSQIAARLGVSQVHVSRLISAACADVRAEALGDRVTAGSKQR